MALDAELIGIKALDRAGLADAARDLGEPRYRGRAGLERWLYGRGVESFDEMTDLPAGLRASLADRLASRRPQIVAAPGVRRRHAQVPRSASADGASVETVGLPSGIA